MQFGGGEVNGEHIDLFSILEGFENHTPDDDSPYIELTEYFRKNKQPVICLKFQEIERILGDRLPWEAYCFEAFWYDDTQELSSPMWRSEEFPFHKFLFSEQSFNITHACSSGMLSIAEYTDKAKVVVEYETAFSDPEIKLRESTENMLLGHPNIKCLLTYIPSTAVDETIMNNPAIDPATFGIFTNTKVDVILERIAASRNNESVLRGLIANGDGHYYHVGRAMLGEVELNEENIAYDELIAITAENVDQFLE